MSKVVVVTGDDALTFQNKINDTIKNLKYDQFEIKNYIASETYVTKNPNLPERFYSVMIIIK